jgi:asparagine synthase (glutamine-hydrolysing)
MPFEEWFRTDLRSYVYEKLSANNLKAIPDLDLKYICDNVELHMERKRNFYPTIWSLIVFINWLEYNKISL